MSLFPTSLMRLIAIREINPEIIGTYHWGQYQNKGLVRQFRSANQPINTIPSSSGGQQHFYIQTNGKKPRKLLAKELLLLSGYPDEFVLIGNYSNWWERIGNSVPPMFMRAIALQIRHKIWGGGQKLKPYPKTMDYLEILDAAWQDHLKLREADAPTVISLFAGGGGSSLGYSMAGYRELLAVEWDNNAVETFKLNFPGIPVYHGDIAKLSVDECMQLADIQPGELDLLDGSPPCQGFSTAGKRILSDPRNQLFREYIRLLRGLKPKVFVMENVSGLVKGKMKLVFAEIMRELKASGYQVKCQLMNAKYFYVPQSRERLIFIGVRDDLGIGGSFPKAKNRPITLKEAIPAIDFLTLGMHGVYKGRVVNAALEPSPTLCKTGLPSYKHVVTEAGKRPPFPSELKKRRWAEVEPGNNHSDRFRLHRLACPKPAATIQKTVTGSGGMMHPDKPRELYDFELKRIGSYPDSFEFIGKWEQVLNRIGNSVPPLFMRSIANHIRQEILSKTNQKAKLTNV